MENNWNLSEKIECLPKDCYGNLGFYYLTLEDVKEFIRLLKENVLCYNESKELMLKELNQLAGKELVEEKEK